jgi:DNA-binding IclR family transcriptional regulator
VPASTVYRALDALQELGLVGHTHVDHRAPSYHLAEHATHLHVVCRGCGWVGEAPLSVADELVARLDESIGFASDVSHAAVHGLCRSCRERVGAEAAAPAGTAAAGDGVALGGGVPDAVSPTPSITPDREVTS